MGAQNPASKARPPGLSVVISQTELQSVKRNYLLKSLVSRFRFRPALSSDPLTLSPCGQR